MASRDDANGPYVLWSDMGYDGWHPKSFDTLEAAAVKALAESYPNVITKAVKFTLTVAEQTD